MTNEFPCQCSRCALMIIWTTTLWNRAIKIEKRRQVWENWSRSIVQGTHLRNKKRMSRSDFIHLVLQFLLKLCQSKEALILGLLRSSFSSKIQIYLLFPRNEIILSNCWFIGYSFHNGCANIIEKFNIFLLQLRYLQYTHGKCHLNCLPKVRVGLIFNIVV